MKKIIGYIRTYYNEVFNWKVFFAIMLFSGVGVYLNYFHPYLQETRNELVWQNEIFIYYFLLFSVPFFGAFIIHALIAQHFEIIKKPKFWLLGLLAMLIFTVRSGSHLWLQDFYQSIAEEKLALYWYKIAHSVVRMLAVLLPIAIYWFVVDRKKMPLYGFTLKNYDTKPYLVMLAVMVPLIAWASFQADFLSTYPRGGELEGLDLKNKADMKYFAFYEFIYGIDFVFIEFFFRGFLILAFIGIAGPHVILPMAAFYVFIHFGKPMGETISSFFGGTLLGILAYYSRSIAGGIIVHMGIAWLMEIGALLSKLYK